jgi:hypothetical protein
MNDAAGRAVQASESMNRLAIVSGWDAGMPPQDHGGNRQDGI